MFAVLTDWHRLAMMMAVGWALLKASLCLAKGGDVILTDQNDDTTNTVAVAQSIVVKLRGNVTTGYTWSLTETNGDSVSVTGPATYSTDAGEGAGVGGTFSFPFRAVGIGETTLAFEYRRSWETGPGAQSFRVTIAVRGGLSSPALGIERQGPNTVISWATAGSDGYYLEGTGQLSTGWAALNVLPIARGQFYTVTLPAAGKALFFRLRQ